MVKNKRVLDLSTRFIRINSHFKIVLGRLILVSLVTIFQALGIICANNWVVTPEIFFLFSNMLLSLEKQSEDDMQAE